MYDRITGRWTQEDPIGVAGGLNLYQFNGNNPVSFSDPFGLCTKQEKGNATQSNVCASDITGSKPAAAKQALGAAFDLMENYERMREANTIGADKYFHAKGNCEAAQRGSAGERTAEVISNGREWVDQHVMGDPQSDSDEDQEANRAGQAVGATHPTGSCSHMVRRFRPHGLNPRY